MGKDALALKHGRLVVTVGMENYYLKYRVKVGAHNNNGHGPNSTEQTIYSAEGSKSYIFGILYLSLI